MLSGRHNDTTYRFALRCLGSTRQDVLAALLALKAAKEGEHHENGVAPVRCVAVDSGWTTHGPTESADTDPPRSSADRFRKAADRRRPDRIEQFYSGAA